ncbi:MAG: hypothetical protein ARM1_0021 [Candidatus Micrarchaeota archaeon]|nr:MAG: hypothetical protein ARM1_0021 [Candidatus Micrarchaeota archaeon]
MEEISFEEAKPLLEKGKRLVWLGVEDKSYIAELLGIDESKILQLSPQEIFYMHPEKAKELEDHPFICYHGNTSRAIGKILESRGVNIKSIKGGITGIIGREL